MSKNSKKSRVSVRTMSLRERRNPQVDDGWDDWDCSYVSQGDDPEVDEVLWDAFVQVYLGKERTFVKAVYRSWESQRAIMVYDVIMIERWMLHNMPEAEQRRRAQDSARAIWDAVLSYSDPSKHRELDLEDVLDQGECSNFCRDNSDQCLEEIETIREWHSRYLERVRFERC